MLKRLERAASLLGQASPTIDWNRGFQHLSLVNLNEVYQDFTCVCLIVPA